MSIAEKFKFYHETLNLSSAEALRLATEGSIREHDLEMKRLEHDLETKRLATEGSIREHDLEMKRLDLEMKRLAKEEWDKENLSEEERRSIREHDLEMKRLDQGRVCVPTIVVSFVKIAML